MPRVEERSHCHIRANGDEWWEKLFKAFGFECFNMNCSLSGSENVSNSSKIQYCNLQLRDKELFEVYRSNNKTPDDINVQEISHTPFYLLSIRRSSWKGISHGGGSASWRASSTKGTESANFSCVSYQVKNTLLRPSTAWYACCAIWISGCKIRSKGASWSQRWEAELIQRLFPASVGPTQLHFNKWTWKWDYSHTSLFLWGISPGGRRITTLQEALAVTGGASSFFLNQI